YRVVYRWRSAREVGGDFFDFMTLHGDKLGLLVADVSDKGIPAALYMMFARTLMRTIAFSGRAPAAMLERSNELIVSDSTTDMFITAYYSILDHRRHILTYASAGHNLAFYMPADGEPEPMTTEGLVLGIINPVHIGQRSLLLAPGDLVMFYTDGVNEALSREGKEFGQERLAGLLSQHRGEPAEAIVDAIEGALREFGGGSAQYDDVTLLLLKRDA
ncbi:MAG TPA: PP2C family protein-serine/threonine phosphatase, partial [Anaerolineae bacterium]